MTAVDEEEFLDHVSARDDVIWLVGRFHPTRRPVAGRERPPFGQRQELELLNRAVGPTTLLSSEGRGNYQGQYLLGSKDPHIEYDRSYFDEQGRLNAGRIYVHAPGASTEHQAGLLRTWYRGLASWITRRYSKIGRYYVGRDASAWAIDGGRTFPDLAKLAEESKSRRTTGCN